ncbi:GNAT family N-acetyltransferase [Collimonas silvisoli]|uniref:GNAT family N-acetyltransferase n=1 Tax=Collimonas silvisoli TaxID=2825884 RepID=UPI001B8AEC93|nr:GNAT family N-acetyltransferase [Collimonas silvisoli]
MTSISNLLTDTSIHDASILDIPFIFDLVVRGSLDGAFTDSFLSSTGYIAALLSLFASIRFFSKLQFLWPRNKKHSKDVERELLVCTYQGEPIGFLQIKTFQEKDGSVVKIIDKCAIKYELRGQGHGKNMINLFVAMQPANTKLIAFCNKYAQSMQRIFRRMHFRRTSVGKGLNLYTLGSFEQEQLDAIAENTR